MILLKSKIVSLKFTLNVSNGSNLQFPESLQASECECVDLSESLAAQVPEVNINSCLYMN